MPIKDKAKKRDYMRDYMRRRRGGGKSQREIIADLEDEIRRLKAAARLKRRKVERLRHSAEPDSPA
jgi:hypothetical protein